MKRALLVCVTSLVGACGPGLGGPAASPPHAAAAPESARAVEALGRTLAAELGEGHFDAVVSHFNSAMTRVMSAAGLAEAWRAQVATQGPYRGVAALRVSATADGTLLVVLCELERGVLELRLVLDGEQRIEQLSLRPSQDRPHPSPPYAELSKLQEVEVTVGSGRWRLPATLTRPRTASSCPAVVLVHGSGPNDRDASVGPNKPFRDLALGLASRGLCVLRYEKRSRQHEKASAALYDQLTVKEETVDDALEAVALLRSRAEVDPARIFVLGHSLGGTVIPRIAARDATIGGFVIMAGSTLPLEESIRHQLAYVASLDGKISEQERALLDDLDQQVARVKALLPADRVAAVELPLGIPVAYWLDLAAHRAADEIQGERRPVLVLQGDRDYQVTLDDFEGWKRALKDNPKAQFRRYPSLNHLFLAGAGKSSPPEYLRPGHVAREVVQDIAAFVLGSGAGADR